MLRTDVVGPETEDVQVRLGIRGLSEGPLARNPLGETVEGAKIDARGYRTDRVYDARVADRWGNRLLYDANGNRTQLLDPDDAVTVYSYDALNRLETVTAPDGGRCSAMVALSGLLSGAQRNYDI